MDWCLAKQFQQLVCEWAKFVTGCDNEHNRPPPLRFKNATAAVMHYSKCTAPGARGKLKLSLERETRAPPASKLSDGVKKTTEATLAVVVESSSGMGNVAQTLSDANVTRRQFMDTVLEATSHLVLSSTRNP